MNIERLLFILNFLNSELKAKKQAIYRHISDTTRTNVWTEEMAALLLEVERTHVHHFREIKAICRPNQLKDFDELMQEID